MTEDELLWMAEWLDRELDEVQPQGEDTEAPAAAHGGGEREQHA